MAPGYTKQKKVVFIVDCDGVRPLFIIFTEQLQRNNKSNTKNYKNISMFNSKNSQKKIILTNLKEQTNKQAQKR